MAASRTPAFRGRARERQALDALLDRVRGGDSAVLVIRGEAGTGKTALMRYCARQASSCQLLPYQNTLGCPRSSAPHVPGVPQHSCSPAPSPSGAAD